MSGRSRLPDQSGVPPASLFCGEACFSKMYICDGLEQLGVCF